MSLTRRDAVKVAAAALLLPAIAKFGHAEEKAKGFTLPKLPYAYDALEPAIDQETMTIHHTKHQQAYITNLNDALAKQDAAWLALTPTEVLIKLKTLPEAAQATVRNNGGGHWNHTFFWESMAPAGKGGEPKGDLLKAINAAYKSLDTFKKEFAAGAGKRFGSGWVWLVPSKEKVLAITSTPNQDNQLMDGQPAPLLGLDVWEHAYYLKYRNKRADYVTAWWSVVNWDAVAERFATAQKA